MAMAGVSSSWRGGKREACLVPVILAFATSILIAFYTISTSHVLQKLSPNQTRLHFKPPVEFSTFNDNNNPLYRIPSATVGGGEATGNRSKVVAEEDFFSDYLPRVNVSQTMNNNEEFFVNYSSSGRRVKNTGQEVYHDEDLFLSEYTSMNKTFKIFIYPNKPKDPFGNILLPVSYEPGGNYASESYFKKSLFKSHFITKDPNEAHLFFLPFSIAELRNDKRVGVGGIKDYVAAYVWSVRKEYPFWNRSGGADHFYVCCHSVGRGAMEKAVDVKLNAIQVVCSSSYFVPGYIAHKDASIPQIWPRPGEPPHRPPEKRQTLAFYAGAMNSRVRRDLVSIWQNDDEISVHRSRLRTPYSEALLGSKYCIHAKGFEINTARIGDAIYYGCVPVILADFYDLPFADVLDWRRFAVVVPTYDIPRLKEILKGIGPEKYAQLQGNVVKVQRHFRWHKSPVDFDAFHMVMFELWLRRSVVRVTY